MDLHCFYLYEVAGDETTHEWYCVEVVLRNGSHARLDRYEVASSMYDGILSNRLFFYTNERRAQFVTWASVTFPVQVIDTRVDRAYNRLTV